MAGLQSVNEQMTLIQKAGTVQSLEVTGAQRDVVLGGLTVPDAPKPLPSWSLNQTKRVAFSLDHYLVNPRKEPGM